ncbi:MAG: sensor histidine kinase KdpD [Williamsia herbipolensis]|nr:sensor histidine kinase KdpD [Williamsia herbipolensis]
MTGGTLRVYLGAAPGVGKTVAMLDEAHRRAERGTDVVIAVVQDHGRTFTRERIGDLPTVPLRTAEHRGTTLLEMDTDAVLRRRPDVALVDELAHTNAPGGRHRQRWQDVRELLAAGIDVITTVNVQHLESLNDAVAAITGVPQRETVPDSVVRAAEQIELVDMTPQALRRRMAHGHVYPAERVDTALAHYFREGNLTALRELALLWVADRVDEGLAAYRERHGIRSTWAARERIVVALPGGAGGAALIRRGARIAGRAKGRDLVAVHVLRSDGSLGASASEIERLRTVAESVGGTLQVVVGEDVAEAVLSYARGVNGTQIVVGASARRGPAKFLRPSVFRAIVDGSGDIDVHVVTAAPRIRAGRRGRLPVRRTVIAWIASVCVPALLAACLLGFRSSLGLASVLFVFQLGVLTTSLIGGVLPAVFTALWAGLLANYLFTEPTGSLTITSPENAFALAVFVVVAAVVAALVDRLRRRTTEAALRSEQAQLLASIAVGGARSDDPVATILEQVRVAFGMASARLQPAGLHDGSDRHAQDVTVVDAGHGCELALAGRPLPAEHATFLDAVARQVGAVRHQVTLAAQAAQNDRLRQTDTVRTALLTAVSHDLRTPLATISASVSSLLDTSLALPEADRRELTRSIADAAGQLDDLIGNLLDLSRLQTGSIAPVLRPTSVDEIVGRALVALDRSRVRDETSDALPLIVTDAGLLERVLANLVANALRHTDSRVRIDAGMVAGRMEIRVADHGPGVPEEQRDSMFDAFQRLGDAPRGAGVGLGLAVARGLAEAVGGTVEADDTPGGGLTMTVSVPVDGPDGTGAPVDTTGVDA